MHKDRDLTAHPEVLEVDIEGVVEVIMATGEVEVVDQLDPGGTAIMLQRSAIIRIKVVV